MRTTFRIDYRTWVPDLDGGEGYAQERNPRTLDTEPLALRFLENVDRLYDARITEITEKVIFWHDPSF